MWTEMPEGWTVQPLSKLCGEVIERVDPTVMNGDLRFHYIGLEHVGQGTGQLEGIGSAADVVSQKSRFHDGDLLFGKLRPNLRKVARPSFGGVCSTDIIVLRAKPSADPEFLFQVLQSDPLIAHAVATAAGTKMPRTHARSILSFEIAVPPLDEQRWIAEVLRSVDEAIAAAEVVATSLLNANKTLRHQLLKVSPDGTINDLPLGWTVRPLEALASVERGKFSVRPRNDPRYFGGSIPFIQTGDITAAGEYIVRHTQTLNDLGVRVSRVFPAGAIMTTIAANIGDFAIATYPVACPDSVVGIEAKAEIEPFWLYSALTCFKTTLDRAATQNAQKNINLQTLRPLQIPVPPRNLMVELAETLSAAAASGNHAKSTTASLMALKQCLVSDLLSGRVRVPAPSATTAKAVPAAFKRAVFAAEIVHQLHNDNRFGSVKHEKIVHLCELHLGLQDDLNRHAYKEAAGPYDPADTLVQVITDELRRQAEEPHGTQYVSAGLSDAVMLDGTFDLRQLAQAILKSGVLTL